MSLIYLVPLLKSLIKKILSEHGVSDSPIIKGEVSEHAIIEGAVYIEEGAKVGPTAYIQGPCFIASGAEVRHGAFIRGNVYVGKNAVVGHTTEVKGSIFFDDAKAGHFAYVGDSILGKNVNLGAGTKLANLKLDNQQVKVKNPETMKRVSSGLRKLELSLVMELKQAVTVFYLLELCFVLIQAYIHVSTFMEP